MDSAARLALEQLARRAVAADLDAVMREVDQVRRELRAVRAAAGVPVAPPETERRRRAAELREQGLSVRAISLVLGAHRQTIATDLKATATPQPPQIVGLDGRVTRGPRPSPGGPVNGWPAAG